MTESKMAAEILEEHKKYYKTNIYTLFYVFLIIAIIRNVLIMIITIVNISVACLISVPCITSGVQ